MLASHNFFNSTIFNTEDEGEKQQLHNDVGPWFRPKQRKYATLDTDRKNNNKSQIRYLKKKNVQQKLRYSNTIQSKIATQPVNVEMDNHVIDINQKAYNARYKNKIQNFLPRIENINKRGHYKGQIYSLYRNNSPLAYQLNFITKKNKKSKKLGYIPQFPNDGLKSFDSIEKFLNQNQFKYNIYQKCVIQIKRSPRNKQLNKI